MANHLNLRDLTRSGRILASALNLSKGLLRPGINPKEIDFEIEKFITSCGGVPSFKNYCPVGFPLPFPAASCISVNTEILHAIPKSTPLKEGDVVTIDIGVAYNDNHTDAARTYIVGKTDNALLKNLIQSVHTALDKAFLVIRDGCRVGDIAFTIHRELLKYKFKPPLGLGGHSIGLKPHGEPFIPNYGKSGTGSIINSGLCLAIEPIAIAGNPEFFIEEDKWTIVSTYGRLSAHEEDTIVVTEKNPIILTRKALDNREV